MLSYYLSLFETDEEQTQFQQLYEHHRRQMYYVAYGVLKNDSHVEDVIHDSFIKLSHNLVKVTDVCSKKTSAYISAVTRNTAIDLLRKDQRHPTVSFDMTYEEAHLRWTSSAGSPPVRFWS